MTIHILRTETAQTLKLLNPVKEILENEVTKSASERKYFDIFMTVEHLFT
jgi:hypothetical protein